MVPVPEKNWSGPPETVAGTNKPAGSFRTTSDRNPLDQAQCADKEANSEQSATLIERLLTEAAPERALMVWLGLTAQNRTIPSKAELLRRLGKDLARIDAIVSRQVNEILHHTAFQKLEASWRGLRYLVDKLPEQGGIKLRVLSVRWREIEQDLTNALEFDQSQLFRLVYESEFGRPGGEPYGVLLGDFEIRHKRTADHTEDDIEVLEKLAGVAAASFAPFISGVHPSFFGLDRFEELERPLNMTRTFEQMEYMRWRKLRSLPDSRFIGLVLPRILLRLPHTTERADGKQVRFREDVSGADSRNYLWGNAIYAFGGVLIRCYSDSGWLADIRGVRQGVDDVTRARYCMEDGGLVTGLPVQNFATDSSGVAVKCSTDVIITDSQDKELEELGFIPLCHCVDTELSAFYHAQSIQQPARFDEAAATANARLSSMLPYILCASRFAHFVKVIGRDRVGSLKSREECEESLRQWLRQYTTASGSGGPEVRAKFPLSEARVEMKEIPGSPGSYYCVLHLCPHYQIEQMRTSLRFTTEIAPPRK